MIKLKDGLITDVMPPLLAKDTNTKCLAYAIHQEHLRIMKLADSTRLMAMIDDLEEPILDVLAVELRSPYYLETLDVEVKRQIVKRTLIWHQKAGTPNAVNELLNIAFGDGHIVEWFDFEDPPYTPGTFDIHTDALLTEGSVDYFNKVVHRVKNTRSHLRRIVIKRELNMAIFKGIAITTDSTTGIDNNMHAETELNNENFTGGVLLQSPFFVLTNEMSAESEIKNNHYLSGALTQCPFLVLESHTTSETTVDNHTSIASCITVIPQITIELGGK